MAKPIVRKPARKISHKPKDTKFFRMVRIATDTIDELNTTAKNPKVEHSFTCTEEQKRAALKFVERTIEIQKIIGPVAPDPADGDDVLSQVNAGYRATVVARLDMGRLVWEQDYKGPFNTVTLRENTGFVLRAEDVLKNGELSKQARAKDYLFAVNGRQALGYEIVTRPNPKATLKAYFGVGRHDQDLAWLYQLIDIRMDQGLTAFACPFCDENVPELFLSSELQCFGCVSCLTALDEGEAERYQRTLKGGAQ